VKAFVDTTILTDVLLNVGPVRAAALTALGRYSHTEIPTYAIKELALGPLRNFVWFHNKLALHSFADAMRALQGMSLTPKRYTTATALQAIVHSAEQMKRETPSTLAAKYGNKASLDEILKDRWRLHLRKIIYSAWKRRRKVTDNVSIPCACLNEEDLEEGPKSTIEIKHIQCITKPECSMAMALKAEPGQLKSLRDVILEQPPKAENVRRAKVLKELYRLPKQPLDKTSCRSLGDAVFAFFAPLDTAILTTNKQDHEPLAKVLGKSVHTP
jgi:hypothetical protein